MFLVIIAAMACTVGHVNNGGQLMKLVNSFMKALEVDAVMQKFSKKITNVPFLFMF